MKKLRAIAEHLRTVLRAEDVLEEASAVDLFPRDSQIGPDRIGLTAVFQATLTLSGMPPDGDGLLFLAGVAHTFSALADPDTEDALTAVRIDRDGDDYTVTAEMTLREDLVFVAAEPGYPGQTILIGGVAMRPEYNPAPAVKAAAITVVP